MRNTINLLNVVTGSSVFHAGARFYSCDYYLYCISITGAGLHNAEPPELSPQQSQHGAVDVIQTDARRAERQTGALDLQDGLVHLSLGRAESGVKEMRAARDQVFFLLGL